MRESEPKPKHQAKDPFTVPRYDRLQDMAAFSLGFEPYHLWHLFYGKGEFPKKTEAERWLRDAPVFLSNFVNSYNANRYGSTLEEFLNLFDEYPVTTEDDEAISARLSGLLPLIFAGSSTDHPGLALIRLVTGLSQTFPPTIRQWFLFGQALGRFFGCLNPKGWDRRFDLLRDLEKSAANTDLDAGFRPNIRREHFLGEEETDYRELDFDEAYADWVPDQITLFVNELSKFLSDEPVAALHKTHHFLWLMGVSVELTPIQSAVLATIAECREDVASRDFIRKRANLDVELQKVDQYVQQIINKITDALREVGPPRYQDTDEKTRRWLREEFLLSVRSAGYRHGKLMDSMTIEE